MIEPLVWSLLLAAALGSGLIAGVFFAFSTFIIKALAKLDPAQGIAAMQSINEVILRSLFMPVFFGTALCGLLLAGWAWWHGETNASPATLSGAACYLVGVILCTVVKNVPLNNALASVTPSSANAAEVWTHYVRVWTFWNHVRTLASAVACVLFIGAAICL